MWPGGNLSCYSPDRVNSPVSPYSPRTLTQEHRQVMVRCVNLLLCVVPLRETQPECRWRTPRRKERRPSTSSYRFTIHVSMYFPLRPQEINDLLWADFHGNRCLLYRFLSKSKKKNPEHVGKISFTSLFKVSLSLQPIVKDHKLLNGITWRFLYRIPVKPVDKHKKCRQAFTYTLT